MACLRALIELLTNGQGKERGVFNQMGSKSLFLGLSVSLLILFAYELVSVKFNTLLRVL